MLLNARSKEFFKDQAKQVKATLLNTRICWEHLEVLGLELLDCVT